MPWCREDLPSNFRCQADLVQAYAQEIGCSCFTCDEYNGRYSFSCSAPTDCEATMENYDLVQSPYDLWSTEDYVWIGLWYVLGALGLYAICWILSKKTCLQRDAVVVPPSPRASRRAMCSKAMDLGRSFVYDVCFGSILEDDGTTRRSFLEYVVNQNKLLAVFRCSCLPAPRGNRSRPFMLRLSKLIASLACVISVAYFFGSLDFDNQFCSVSASVAACKTCQCATYCNGYNIGCDANCECKPNSNCFSYSCQSSTSDLQTSQSTSSYSNSCDQITFSSDLFSISSFISLGIQQILQFIDRKMTETARNGTFLDHLLHMVWCGAAIGSIAIIWLTSDPVSDSTGDKPSELRIQKIMAVAISSFFQDQITNLVQAPVQYWTFATWHWCCGKNVEIVEKKVNAFVNNTKPPKTDLTNATSGAVVRPVDVHLTSLSGLPSN